MRAQLLAADYLPSMWVADEPTHALRRQDARGAHIVRQRTRLKNQVQAILHRNLVARCPTADMFALMGRAWLANQPLPGDEKLAVAALLRQLDFHGHELRIIDAELARVALERADMRRLMTIPGVDATILMFPPALSLTEVGRSTVCAPDLCRVAESARHADAERRVESELP